MEETGAARVGGRGGAVEDVVAEQKRGANSSSQIHRAVVFHLSRSGNIRRLNENETNRDEVVRYKKSYTL